MRPSREEAERHVGFWTAMIHRRFRRYFAGRLEALGLPNIPLWALSRILHGPAPCQEELTERSGRDKGTVSRWLLAMEQAGLVTREQDPDDARLKRVYTTEQGKALAPLIGESIDEWESTLTRGLTPEERDRVLGLLRRMAENVGELAPPCCDTDGPPAGPRSAGEPRSAAADSRE